MPTHSQRGFSSLPPYPHVAPFLRHAGTDGSVFGIGVFLACFFTLTRLSSHLLCWSSSPITWEHVHKKLGKYVCLQSARSGPAEQYRSRSSLGALPGWTHGLAAIAGLELLRCSRDETEAGSCGVCVVGLGCGCVAGDTQS